MCCEIFEYGKCLKNGNFIILNKLSPGNIYFEVSLLRKYFLEIGCRKKVFNQNHYH